MVDNKKVVKALVAARALAGAFITPISTQAK